MKKLDHFHCRAENQKYLKPPPSLINVWERAMDERRGRIQKILRNKRLLSFKLLGGLARQVAFQL